MNEEELRRARIDQIILRFGKDWLIEKRKAFENMQANGLLYSLNLDSYLIKAVENWGSIDFVLIYKENKEKCNVGLYYGSPLKLAVSDEFEITKAIENSALSELYVGLKQIGQSCSEFSLCCFKDGSIAVRNCKY